MKINRIVAAALSLSLAFTAVSAVAQEAMVNGEVKKIDEAAGKITLKHGPIKKLDMEEDSMTMVFRVKDPAILNRFKVGDNIKFDADRVNGQITVTAIQKSK